MTLGAADDDPVFPFLDYVEVHVRIRLLLGGEVPVPLDVGHPGVGHEVVLLHVLQELDEPLIVLGPVLLIDVVGRDRQRDHAVQSGAALETGADAPTQQAVYLDPGYQVRDGLRRIVEPVDRLVDQGAFGHHQVAVFRALGKLVGLRCRLDPCPDARVVDDVFDLLPEHVHRRLEPSERLDIFGFCLQPHLSSPLLMYY